MATSENPFHSKRLIYRAIEPTEDESFILSILQDPISYRNANVRPAVPQAKKDATKYINHVIDDSLISVVICLPVPAPSTSQPTSELAKPIPIGCIFLSQEKPHIMHHRFTEIGIDIEKSYQGQGYGTEAIEWILEWAFMTAGMHRVEIRCFSYNEGARRLYGRIFKEEGVEREKIWFQGRWWDGVLFGLLEGEWREKQAERGRVEG